MTFVATPHVAAVPSPAVAPGAGADARLATIPRQAGAVTVQRDGRPVIAHYGSVAGEVAVCVKRAGIVDRSELEKLELRGGEAWLDHVLAKAVGEPVPVPGWASSAADAWCCRVAPDRALVIGPHTALARWRGLVRHAIVGGTAVACSDVASLGAVSVVGPHTARVLAAAGLPADLPVRAVQNITSCRCRHDVINADRVVMPTSC